MNQKLLQQLMLAKEAGSNAMAKDFFAKTPGTGGPTEGGDMPGSGSNADAPGGAMGAGGGMDAGGEAPGAEMKPEDLEELLQLLGAQGQGK